MKEKKNVRANERSFYMKLIPWNCFDEIEAYTTCAYDENNELCNMSFNNIDDQQVLCNRKNLQNNLIPILNIWLQHISNILPTL